MGSVQNYGRESRQSYVVIPGGEPIGRLLSNRVLAEELGNHCGIEVGTHLDDGLPTEPGDPAVMVVEAHPVSRDCVRDKLDHRDVARDDHVGDPQLRTIGERLLPSLLNVPSWKARLEG